MHCAHCMGEGHRKKHCFVVSRTSDSWTGLHWGSRRRGLPPAPRHILMGKLFC